MATVDPRLKGKLLWGALNDMAVRNSTTNSDWTDASSGQDPGNETGTGSGWKDPGNDGQTGNSGGSSDSSNAGGTGYGDFWSRFLAAIKPYLGQSGYDQIAGNYDKLNPLLNAGASAFGGENNVIKYLGYNPLKGAYTALSYLNGTPYYDKGNAADGSETWNAFYVPGFDYDPNTPGVQGPSWTKNPYDPAGHYFRT